MLLHRQNLEPKRKGTYISMNCYSLEYVNTADLPIHAKAATESVPRPGDFQDRTQAVKLELSTMTIELNHTIVPARDRQEAADWFAKIFGLEHSASKGHFSPLSVNERLTLLFDNQDRIESHHLAFHVDDGYFDEILHRLKTFNVPFGSDPGHLDNQQLNDWNEGRGVYFTSPDGHILELMTEPQ